MQEKDAKAIGGFNTTSLIIPLGVVLAVLLLAITIFVIRVNRATNQLTDTMQSFTHYQQEATSLQAGASLLSETAGTFALKPLNENGEVNVGPLTAFSRELVENRRGPQVVERFREFDVSRETMDLVESSADCAEQLLQVQLHVISLIRSVYPLPPIPVLSAIPEVPLTEEELAMPPEERVAYARSLILEESYVQNRFLINQDINSCHNNLQSEFARKASETQWRISTLRIALWVVIFAIIFILLVTFIMFYRWVVNPLRGYARLITSGERLEVRGSVRELRLVAAAYNELLGRRNRLEAILRSAAETDPLTGLPNRYSMERNVLEAETDSCSMAVLLFDVNYLKQMNDTQGHLAGDRLLRTAGDCLSESFGRGNAYRIGGDEFAVILRDCDEESVKLRIDHFLWAQERDKISVSFGYAFTQETDADSFKALVAEADKRMYAHKKRIHEAERQGEGAAAPAAQ